MQSREISVEGCQIIVYEDGRIYSFTKGGFLMPYDNGLGYKAVKLRINGRRVQKYVHRLVAEAFLDGCGTDVNHMDGDKSNNHRENLEYMSRSENLKHAFENRLLKGFVSEYY